MAEHIDGPLYYETMGKSGPAWPSCIRTRWTSRAGSSRWRRCPPVSLHSHRSAGLWEVTEGEPRTHHAGHRAGLLGGDRRCISGRTTILVGCSIGSSMLIWMYNHRPQQTAALIMCGTGYNPKKEFIPARIEAYREYGIDYRWGYTFEDLSPAFRSTPIAHFFADMFADRNVFGDVNTIVTQFQAYNSPSPRVIIPRIACPAIIITGSEDNTHRAAFALQKRIAGCKLRILLRRRPCLSDRAAKPFNRYMIEFLASHSLFPGAARRG